MENILNKKMKRLNDWEIDLMVQIIGEEILGLIDTGKNPNALLFQIFDLGNLAFSDGTKLRCWKDKVGNFLREKCASLTHFLRGDQAGDWLYYIPAGTEERRETPLGDAMKLFFLGIESYVNHVAILAMNSNQHASFEKIYFDLIEKTKARIEQKFQSQVSA